MGQGILYDNNQSNVTVTQTSRQQQTSPVLVLTVQSTSVADVTRDGPVAGFSTFLAFTGQCSRDLAFTITGKFMLDL